ncbi:unnamed protein product, partial [Closterium sp. NIES-54]
ATLGPTRPNTMSSAVITALPRTRNGTWLLLLLALRVPMLLLLLLMLVLLLPLPLLLSNLLTGVLLA